MPIVLAWDEQNWPILVLEDLSMATWPPPWEAASVARVLKVLDQIHAYPIGVELPRLTQLRSEFEGWSAIAADPHPFLSLGLADSNWLAATLPCLIDASVNAPLDGDEFLHADVRSDNVALLPDRIVLVDWDRCAIGNGAFDAAFWAPSLYLEGGPPPEAVAPRQPELAALVAGFFAARAGLPPPWPDSVVRSFQLAQLRVALPWACRTLGLALPSGLS